MNKYPFFIAEAGVNHNGDIHLAYQLVDAAVQAGADAIKFQTFSAEAVVTYSGKMARYQKDNLGYEESQIDMLRKLELNKQEFINLKTYCEKKQIEFMSTPHGSFASVDLLESLDMKQYKTGSGDLTNLPVLEYISKLNKPMIVATGMATLCEVEEAVDIITTHLDTSLITLLHCTTNYPCPEHEVNLRAMQTMKEKFPSISIGYSDHTLGQKVPILAACLGATCIEKHFTLDRTLPGPDHAASAEPHELKDIIEHTRGVIDNEISFEEIEKMHGEKTIENILGSGVKEPTDSEQQPRKSARRSIVITKDISAGHILTHTDIDMKRPAEGGLHPREYRSLLGKEVITDLSYDTQITYEHVR